MKTLRWGGVAVAAMLLVQGWGTALGQAITGDLDANHEVSLSDLSGFVGCVSGPGAPSLDPLCVGAMFDEDDDVDLHEVAGFQNRFGFGVGPPRIDRFWPPPGEWIVDDAGLTEVRIGFTEPVIVPDGSIDVWVVSRLQIDGGDVTGFTTEYDPEDFVLTVTFAEPLRDDRVTIIVDYLIEDLAGNPLDGEIYNPHNAVLPSGNGVNGGQGVFRIHVLQGDANRDGIVDDADLALVNASLGLCAGDPGFDPNADLNEDGCVDLTDEDLLMAALGRQLPVLDGTSLIVTEVIISTTGPPYTGIRVAFNEWLSFSVFNNRSCYLTDQQGNVSLPVLATPTGSGTAAEYFFEASCSSSMINVSNSLADSSGELLTALEPQSCP